MPRKLTPLQRAILIEVVNYTQAATKDIRPGASATIIGISNLGIRSVLPAHMFPATTAQSAQADSVRTALSSLLMRGLVWRQQGASGDEWLAKLPDAFDVLEEQDGAAVAAEEARKGRGPTEAKR